MNLDYGIDLVVSHEGIAEKIRTSGRNPRTEMHELEETRDIVQIAFIALGGVALLFGLVNFLTFSPISFLFYSAVGFSSLCMSSVLNTRVDEIKAQLFGRSRAEV
jgi:hypothetical protein